MKLIKKFHVFSLILMLIGIGFILYPQISNYLAEKNQVEAIEKYKQNSSNMSEEEINLEYEKARQYNGNYEDLLNISNDGIMAYIEIPKISTYLPIYHGTEDTVLKKGVGHLKNTSLPIGGKSTHCVLLGHTGLSKSELFTRLNELELEDYVYIYVLNQKLTYKVYQIQTVLPTELDDLQIIEGQDIITLVTCTPYGINTHRLLVHATRVEYDEYIEENTTNQTSENKNNYFYYEILLIIFCCILFKYIVKYIKKKIKKESD